jgi:hypothetical protein
MMSNTNSVVAVFETHDQAENAIRELQKDGFDMKNLSIVGQDYHTEEHVVGYYTTGDRMLYWGKLGAFWGGFWGLLLGSAFFWVPGIGHLLVAGPLVVWIVGALENAALTGGLTALGAGLYSIGIPKNGVLQYETEVKNGKLLLVAHGTPGEVERAKNILDQSSAIRSTLHGGSADMSGKASTTVQIEVEGRIIPFTLVPEMGQWHSAEEQKESDFPLITVVNRKRCELYSDGTFAEVER